MPTWRWPWPPSARAQRVGQADAAVRQAEANAEKAHADLERITPLAAQGIVSRQQLDAAQTAVRAADAALAAAQAALLGRGRPRGLGARVARPGGAAALLHADRRGPGRSRRARRASRWASWCSRASRSSAWCRSEDVWVTANLKETQIEDVTPGDAVDFTVDAYPGVHFRGHVESLSPATGARFSLLPPDNATGNFTKVVQRIPVRIRPDGAPDPAHPLRPGMSVNVTITTK